jgi:hypothetical protein
MPKNVVPLTIQAPGFFGLNTQQSGSILPPGWATKLDNVVYDSLGRIGARKGSEKLNATVIPNTPTVKASHEYIDASGVKVHILAADNKIFKEVSGTITDISGTITTPTDDHWQFVNFNGWCVGFQDGHAPIVATSATAPVFANSGGTQYNGSMVLSAYGRLWTVLDNTLRYSDLLINNFTGGTSGSLDLSLAWPDGMDEAVALADFNGLLVVFGKHSIILYENADDIANISLLEGIGGIGCIARDSVQLVGKDMVFLSASGLRSMQRTLIDQVRPLTDISKHVRDALIAEAASETEGDIVSVYNELDGFYALSLPTTGKTYVFDLKFPNEDDTWKVSNWTFAPTAFNYTSGNAMYLARTAGYISQYTGYRDEDDAGGGGGSAFLLDYEGVWNDLGEEVANYIKIPKNVSVLASGTAGGIVTFKWAVDYSSTFKERPLAFSLNAPSSYGVGQYGIATYASTGEFERVSSELALSGQVLKIGLSTDINGNPFALQRIDVLSKIGRIGF